MRCTFPPSIVFRQKIGLMEFDPAPWPILWAIASGIFTLAFRRGFDMTSQQRWLASSVWYLISVLPLGAVSLWSAMSNSAPTTRWVVLGVIGASVGACLFIAAGEAF